MITHFTRDVCARVLPAAALRLLYDVSHNTCKVEEHVVDGRRKTVYIHRKDATRLADRPQRVGQTGVAGSRRSGRQVVDELGRRGILIRSPSLRGVARGGARRYKDVTEVVDAAEQAGLSKKRAKLLPVVTIKG